MLNFDGSYIVFELTNFCNLKCKHCIQQYREHIHTNDGGFLDPEILYGALEDMARHDMRFHTLILFWIGEPLLHPKFDEIYQHIIEFNARHPVFKKLEVHTNSNLLRERVRDLATNDQDSIFQVWHCTMDAVHPEAYKAIKGKDDLELVQKNVRELIRLRAEKKTMYPKMVFQFIVHPDNVAEAPEYLSMWQGACHDAGLDCGATGFHPNFDRDNCVFFRQLDCLDPSEQEESNARYLGLLTELGLLTPQRESVVSRLRSRVMTPNTGTCSGFFKSPVVNWDGRVTTCTRDNEMDNLLGDLREQSFHEIWWENEALARYRKGAIQGRYDELPICQTCIIPKSANYTQMTRPEIRAYRRQAIGPVIPFLQRA